MIRTTSVATVAVLVLSACQPGGGAAGDRSAVPSPEERASQDHDWRFRVQDGSGELDFAGDDAIGGGDSLFHLACRPGSGAVEMSWGARPEAVLTSGTATGTFRSGARATTDHPVLRALKASGVIALGLGWDDLTLSAKDRGRGDLAAFFDYCDHQAPPPPLPADAAPVEPATASEGEPVETTPGETGPGLPASVEPVPAETAEPESPSPPAA